MPVVYVNYPGETSLKQINLDHMLRINGIFRQLQGHLLLIECR